MNRISLGLGVLFGLVFTGAIAQAEPVQTGALDICKLIDGGEVSFEETDSGPAEVCCATERLGDETFGRRYWVACLVGTNTCHHTYATRSRPETIRKLGKMLATTKKQATVMRN